VDDTPLAEAMDRIDNAVETPPTGYAVNRVHPQIFASGMSALDQAHRKRTGAYQANTANLRPEELEGSAELISDEPDAPQIDGPPQHHAFHTLFMGGCCGTDTRHIEQLALQYTTMA